MSLRQQISEHLYWASVPRTSTAINNFLNGDPIRMKPGSRAKLASVSSALKKMVDEGLLLRIKGFGPRGGYGYLTNPKAREQLRVVARIPKPCVPSPSIGPVSQMYLDHAGWREDR